MSQFPINDPAGLYEAVNYLASGPAGLGQNFGGFVSYTPTYVTSYYRAPFGLPTDPSSNADRTKWYTSPININNITGLTPTSFKVEFSGAPLASAPYFLGQALQISGVDPSFYDGYYRTPGVLECTDSYVIIGTTTPYVWPTYVSGGTIQLNAADDYVSTDANGRVEVYGAQDKVFVSGQINLDFDYTSDAVGSVDLYVAINRYAGFLDTSDPENPDYLFNQRTTIVEQLHTIDVASGTGSITGQEFVFTTLIDSPTYTTKDTNGNNATKGYGYYWYILELYFDSNNGSGAIVYPTQVTTNLRSLTAQVIKQ